MTLRVILAALLFLCSTVTPAMATEVELTVVPAPGDSRGTNMKNIYVLIARAPKGKRDTNPYIIAFYANGILLQSMRQKTLPVSIVRNFTGLGPGNHEVKVDVEANSQIVASAKAAVKVER